MDLTDILVDILIDKMEYNLKMKPQPIRKVEFVDDFKVSIRKNKSLEKEYEPPKKKRKITYSMSI